ncbi:MAG: SDR family oxidoreductase [Deltaproteobacteria bacterium]|nr:SDR family oxidoreductase [Deltaproteobacteria bacterium]
MTFSKETLLKETLLKEKVGIVTGSAQGLGEAIAQLAAHEGSRLVLADIQAEAGESVAEAIRRTGGEAVFQRTDVTESEQVALLVDTAVERFGRLDWICNNAVGGAGQFGPLDQLDDRGWTTTVDVCLKGVFHGMKYAIPAMLAGGGGSVVNITTSGLFKGEAMLGAYVAAKGGVHALTMSGAAEYSGRGVRINSVAPGGMETPAIARYFEKFPEFKQKTIDQHAMRRLGRPAEVAEPVVWLASDRASFVTGSCIVCDGGTLVNSHLL